MASCMWQSCDLNPALPNVKAHVLFFKCFSSTVDIQYYVSFRYATW